MHSSDQFSSNWPPGSPIRIATEAGVSDYEGLTRGAGRRHERPNREEILACRMWLDAEIAQVRPQAQAIARLR